MEKILRIGDRIRMDDGLIELVVIKIVNNRIVTRVLNGGFLSDNKGVNLPGVKIDLPAVSEKDAHDFEFAIQHGIDFVGISFARKAEDIQNVRAALGERGKHIKVISKIENQEGLENFDEVLAVSDGIMVERGDLGAELPFEQVTTAQKMIIQKCNVAGKPVITATHLLESMTNNPSPTRAEASDVLNAVLDGTDCVMLSGETAIGKFPVEAIKMMVNLCREAEVKMNRRSIFNSLYKRLKDEELNIAEIIASSAVRATFDVGAALLVVFSESGQMARMTAKYRPNVPILTVTSNEQTARHCLVFCGVFQVLVDSTISSDKLLHKILSVSQLLGICKLGDIVVYTSGKDGYNGATNYIRIAQVGHD